MDKPDYEKAKKLLRAKIAEVMPGAPIDDYTLAWALDTALDDNVGVTDGTTAVSPSGRCLMGPSNADWAEMALWAILSPP